MKVRNIILGIAFALGCSACNDWLTVQPDTMIVEEDMCTTDEGVKQLLNGMYLKMRGTLYHPGMTLGGGDCLPEGLACTWTPAGERLIALAARDYKTKPSVISLLNNTFRDLYDVIAMANDLVKNADLHKGLLTDSVYNIGMGEALAIRALCHLDLIRLWGPMPAHVDAGKNYLPYVRVNSTALYDYLPYEKYMELLFEDLDRAEELLGGSDPVVKVSFESTEMNGAEWTSRKSRINYWGVLGLQARARLWYGDKDEALRYARLVIDAKNPDGSTKVRLMNLEDDFPLVESTVLPGFFARSMTDGAAYPEHLCGMKCDDWYTWDINKSGWSGAQASLFVDGYENVEEFKALFDNNSNDLRQAQLWQSADRPSWGIFRRSFRKYERFYNNPSSPFPANFPIVRLSEMYLIVMECAPLAEANEAWKVFSAARELEYVPYTEADRGERVYKEWIRELIGEGQNFYTYKRYGVTRMYFNPVEITNEQYVLPIPEKEFLK